MKNKNPEIIYEDKNILVIDKPAGLVVHADGRTKEITLADWLVKKYPKIKKVGEPATDEKTGKPIYRPGIVHRLDRETSGVMVIAKNQDTFLFLKQQFQEREIRKTYRAFLFGELKTLRGMIDRPIGRSGSDFRKWSATRGAKGEMREAKTHFHTLALGKGCTYVEAVPKTGRTHQIRVHFKAINHPVLCDNLYGPAKSCLLGFKRTALHAKSLTLQLPGGENRTFEAPLPQDFKKAEKLIGFLK